MRLSVAIFKTLTVVAITVLLAEVALRIVRSLERDGAVHVSSPSADVEPHAAYGWISPRSRRVKKNDACFGRGWVSYNEAGFRAPPMERAGQADIVVCILGDSTMQASRLPDGQHVPHLLERRLRQTHSRPFVLPLAVAGYGSVQEWLLFEDHCRDLDPAVVIQHWSANDPVNNSYLAERYSGPVNNNARPRPYLEHGQPVVRRPYPVRISDPVDRLLLTRVLNTLLLRWSVQPESSIAGLERGWEVAEEMTRRLAETRAARIALVEESEERAIEMFGRSGFSVATYESLELDETCLPSDPHPNAAGHLELLEALWPVVERSLAGAPGRLGASPVPPSQSERDGGAGRSES